MAKKTAVAKKKTKQQDELKRALEAAMDAEAMAQAVIDGLQAVKVFQQRGEVVKEPDYLTRLKYLEFIRDTVEGQPVKRQEMVHFTAPNVNDLRTKLEGSPALRESLQRLLNDVQSKQSAASEKGDASGGGESPEFVDV